MAVHYRFPLIRHIDDVLPFIDADCFRVVAKDCGNTYINYVKMGNDTFPSMPTEAEWTRAAGDDYELHGLNQDADRAAIRRECRGIAFDTATGEIVSRPFHKFFNVGEREDMDIPTLNFNAAHVVQDKVDGSMVRPVPTEAGIRWGTKMGVTDTAMFAETWLVDHPDYYELAERYMSEGFTPIFEYVSPENRVVVDYGKRDMILLAVRDNLTGNYLLHDALVNIGERYGIPVVGVYDPVEGDPTTYLSAIKDSDDLDEGIVIQWDNGHRAKVKTETYSILHKVKEAGRTERTLIQAIWDGKVDDLLPLLPEDERAKVQKFVSLFWKSVSDLSDDIFVLYNSMRAEYDTKKDFALGTADTLTQMERGVVFGMWDDKYGATDAGINIIKNGLSSETKWAETKQNIAMATNLNNLVAHWQGTEDIE